MSENNPGTNGVVVEVEGLGRVFKRKVALSAVDVAVPRGCVFGLVGENGAGKTTLIKHLLGVYKAKTGSVRVFGLDPVKHPVDVLGRIGYLSEDRDILAAIVRTVIFSSHLLDEVERDDIALAVSRLDLRKWAR